MDSQYLESFLAVVEHGSLAEAARRLGLTPGAVTQRVRALEDEIGVPLLERAGRTVTPTPSGRAILDQARALLQNVAELRNLAHEASQVDGSLTGELRLGAIPTAITGLLPPILERLRRLYPQLYVLIVPGSSEEIHDRVVSGEVDAGVLVKPPFVLSKAYVFDTWREEPLLLIAPPEMAERDPIALLSTEPFIRYDRTNWGGRLADEYLSQLHVQPKEKLELSSLEAIAVMVARGAGVALVPDWAPPWPEGLKLARFLLPEAPRRHIGFLTRQGARPQPVIAAFAREAEQVLKSFRDAK
jgi:DNA-binding transcriptional LysR family regulator